MAETSVSDPLLAPITPASPTRPAQRIVSLDVVRGVALLGILILNIVGMGMLSTAYYNPHGGVDGSHASSLDLSVWFVNELFFEGSMRALFSMLFGAGVILFTTTKSGALHYRRTFWLFVFGVFDGFFLQWTGDILLVYAIAGALLYFARNASAKRLVVIACALLVTLGLLRIASVYGLGLSEAAYKGNVASELAGEPVSPERADLASDWTDFLSGAVLPAEEQAQELAARRGSYLSSFRWSAVKFGETLLFVVPFFLLWDALAMMMIGMALYRGGVLQGERSASFYLKMAGAGIGLGLLVNSFELNRVLASDYAVLQSFSFIQPTYDLGRLGLGLGYMALIVWWVKRGFLQPVLARLAAVGQMALTNYLMHSLIALVLFTGAGFGLVAKLDRLQLYFIVFAIWGLQLWLSPWWLARHQQGPLEALWRRLTYGRATG